MFPPFFAQKQFVEAFMFPVFLVFLVRLLPPATLPKVLSHYDEVKKDGAKLTLGQGGTARDGAAAAGGTGEEKTKVLESLKVDVKDASEYYTTEEMAKFKKPKKVRFDSIRFVLTSKITKYKLYAHAMQTCLFTCVRNAVVCVCVFPWLGLVLEWNKMISCASNDQNQPFVLTHTLSLPLPPSPARSLFRSSPDDNLGQQFAAAHTSPTSCPCSPATHYRRRRRRRCAGRNSANGRRPARRPPSD